MDASGITPVMNMGNDNGFGMNGLGGIFALLVLLGLFNGGFGGFGGGNQQYATRDQVQNGFDNQNMQFATSGILNAVTEGTAQVIANNAQNNNALIREFSNVENALTALTGRQMECCGSVLRAIDGVNYNTTIQIQKVLDAMAANRISELEGKVNSLQLQAATSNVLRFPNAWTYAGGYFPPIQPGTTTTPAT